LLLHKNVMHAIIIIESGIIDLSAANKLWATFFDPFLCIWLELTSRVVLDTNSFLLAFYLLGF
jgi:hypothetical protein